MEYCISLLVNADNAIDVAHAKRCPLPFLSSMIDDCIKRGKTVQEGGAVYNFTGPQGFGIANMADSLYAIRQLVYQEKKFTMEELKEALAWNYGKDLDEQSVRDITTGILREMTESGAKVDADTAAAVLKSVMNAQMSPEKMARYQEIHDMIAEVPKFGNDLPEVDTLQGTWLTHTQDRYRTLRTQEADSTRPDFIRYLQMYRWADRLVLHQMADMHTLRLLTVFPHQQARM